LNYAGTKLSTLLVGSTSLLTVAPV
jgi:hypothetical protein